jgi:hypothetical protein
MNDMIITVHIWSSLVNFQGISRCHLLLPPLYSDTSKDDDRARETEKDTENDGYCYDDRPSLCVSLATSAIS